MKTIVLASALAVLVSGSALAATNHTTDHLRHERRLSDSNASARDPIGVYIDGQEIGRDPDPNVREELYNEYYELQGR